MLRQPFYDPARSFEDNFAQGPFADMADDKQVAYTTPPTYDFFGQAIYFPFGIPAGPLMSQRHISAAFRKGFPLAVYKTVRTRTYPCHPLPNIVPVAIPGGDLTIEMAQGSVVAQSEFTEPLTITNSFGVPSQSPDFWQDDMRVAVAKTPMGHLVIGSFQGTKQESGTPEALIADYVLAARMVQETGAKVLEANLSCPNEGKSDLLCFDLERVAAIARQIKEVIGNTPLLLKLAYFEQEAMLQQLVEVVGSVVDGFSVINTIPAAIVDTQGQQALPGEGRLRSGVCGAGIQWAARDMVTRLVKIRETKGLQFKIIAGGGVMSAADYQRFISLGADGVMSATGSMWNAYLAQEIGQTLQMA